MIEAPGTLRRGTIVRIDLGLYYVRNRTGRKLLSFKIHLKNSAKYGEIFINDDEEIRACGLDRDFVISIREVSRRPVRYAYPIGQASDALVERVEAEIASV